MSKLYLKYLEEKKKDSDTMYLFKSGMFYIFIDEDAKRISEITPLVLSKLTNEISKCGFPSNSLDKYLNIFKNLNIKVKVIEDNSSEDNKDKIIRKLKDINIDNITPIKALNILEELSVLACE